MDHGSMREEDQSVAAHEGPQNDGELSKAPQGARPPVGPGQEQRGDMNLEEFELDDIEEIESKVFA